MITLITGTPGAGKTAYAVAQLEEFIAANPDRPVYVMGIPELLLWHAVVPPVSDWTIQVQADEDASLLEAVFTFPEGALIIIDEAQKVFRPRSVGSKVPDYVAAFEKHRHQGLDFWLITQAPTLVDSNVRKLVGKHIHLRALWSGRKLYEWAECSDPESRTDRAAAAVRSYKLPKGIFGKYKSASVHVKQRQRAPLAVYGVAIGVAVVGFLGWRAYHRLTADKTPVPATRSAEQSGPVGVPALPQGGQQVPAPGQQIAGATVSDWTPRITTRPETAPMYDGIRQVKTMPVVVGCVAMADRCTCFTEQGTDAFLDDGQCREWLKHPPFNPWRESRHEVAQVSQGTQN
ncbi:MAG: zonular occludens toxin domain-containing protein [Rhodocyclaceae bacterium]